MEERMAERQWYMAIDGQQVGPVTEEDLVSRIRGGSLGVATLVFTAGMSGWKKAGEVLELAGGAWPLAAAAPPIPPRVTDEIDYQILGTEMQFVEVTLDPGESVVAEAGVLMYMSAGIQMETIFGDGSRQRGIIDALLGAGRRLLTGETLFMTVFTNRGAGRERVAFAAPYAGKIIPMDLRALGGELVCQKDSFLFAVRGVSIQIAFQRKLGVGLFGGEGFIMQRLQGDGLCFVHAGGTVHSVDLQAGEVLRVDTGCIVALQPSVGYDIQFVGKIKTALFGGEGIFFAALTGPGRVWLQSLPFSRLADRIYRAAPQTGGKRKEEGSILDSALGIGRMIDGR
jgi:uncharacterized protein (TIGR00266 family)